MKVTMRAGSLRDALSVAQLTMRRSPTLPVLTHVLLEATPDGGVIVSGTDIEARAWRTIAAQVDEPGAVTLPPDMLDNFLDAISPDDSVALAVDARHKAELTSGRVRIRVAGMDADEFPSCPDLSDPAADVTLGADTFASLLSGVAHCFAPDDSRPTLAGILIRITGGRLDMAAADGLRLAYRSMEIDAPDMSVLPRGRDLAKIGKLLGKSTSVRLMVGAATNVLAIETEAGAIALRILDGQFPDFQRIIPRDQPVLVTVRRDDIKRAVRLIRGTRERIIGESGKTYSDVMARVTFGAETLEMRARDGERDQEAESVIPITLERGDPGLLMGFNGSHLAAAIEAIDDDHICLEMTDSSRPALIRGASGRDNLQVLMPVKVTAPAARPAAAGEGGA